MKVLIADDEQISRLMLDRIVRNLGFETVLAKDGEEAWLYLQSDMPPMLLILDWVMPGLSGVDVCRMVRKRMHQNPPYIIIVTSRGDKSDIVEGLKSGANDYIAKPYHTEELKARVEVGRRMVELQCRLVDAKKELEFMATHDCLTGILNRGAVMRALETEMSRAQRENKSLGFAMCDLDHFKQINDRYGHQVGDEVLRSFVKRVKTLLRDYDLIGRYGGEEFMLVTPGLQARGNTSIFERIRFEIAKMPFSVRDEKIPVTVSIGVAEYTGKGDVESVLKAADRALYRAKDAGRDRVVFDDA